MKKNIIIFLSLFLAFSFLFNKLYATNDPSNFEKVSFFKAVETGDLKKAKELFKKNARLVFQKNHLKETPLLLALKKGYQKLTLFLLKKKSPLNEQDKDGHTALHLAILINNHKLVRELITNGAIVTIATHDGYTPLHYAALTGNIGILLILLSETDEIDLQTKDGITPLLCAQSNKHKDIERLLLQKITSLKK